MIPRPARYLLRFDDLCPTMRRQGWERFLPIIADFGLRPILAVVPENRDPGLACDAFNAEFWAEMRAMEAAGSTIALHGYQHLCLSEGRSLIPLHRRTEFAGVELERQRLWIKAGMAILQEHGLTPRVWVAPRHGFDRNTLQVLREQGVGVISDGFAKAPFVRGGVTWIPQQLWGPVEKRAGAWTICIHANTAGDPLVAELREFLRKFRGQFTSVDDLIEECGADRQGMVERIGGSLAALKFIARRWRKSGQPHIA